MTTSERPDPLLWLAGSQLLDGQAVPVERHEELTEGARIDVLDIIRRLRKEEDIPPGDLQKLVEGHIVRASVFRSVS